MARSLRGIVDSRRIRSVAPHQLANYLRLKIVEESGVRALGAIDQAVEVHRRELHVIQCFLLLLALHQGCSTAGFESVVAVKVQGLRETVVDFFGDSCYALKRFGGRSAHLSLAKTINKVGNGLINMI